jgi:hypothetical protein
MTNNIYKSNLLKYPLSDEEFDKIDKVWNFLKIFEKPIISISKYRKYLIKKINEKYTIQEFFLYESILNKLFWNLRYLIAPILSQNENTKELSYCLTLCEIKKYDTSEELNNIINENKIKNVYYRSFINKLIIIDEKQKIIHLKKMEGSSDIFSKNYFNLYTMTILFDKALYDQIIKDPPIIKSINVKLSKYYYEHDYGFPNMNYCTYSFNTDEQKMKRIKKMYFSKNDKYWFKLIMTSH